MEEKKIVVYVLHGFWENEFTNGCAVVDVSIDLEAVMKKLDEIVESKAREYVKVQEDKAEEERGFRCFEIWDENGQSAKFYIVEQYLELSQSMMEAMFQDEPDNNKLNVVLDLADAYVEYEYEERKKSEKVQWGKDVCAAAGEDTDEFPEQVFVSISEKLEDRMLENNGDLEYAVVQEVVNEFWEREEGKDADCKPE